MTLLDITIEFHDGVRMNRRTRRLDERECGQAIDTALTTAVRMGIMVNVTIHGDILAVKRLMAFDRFMRGTFPRLDPAFDYTGMLKTAPDQKP